MKRIEELFKFARNKQRYGYLKSELLAHHLAVFFGAGLSLGGKMAREWRGPFSQICNEILLPKLTDFERFIDALKQPEKIKQDKIQIAKIRTMLSQAEELFLTGDFLEAGDKLSEAFEKIKEVYDSYGIRGDLGDIQDKSFDDLIVDVFKSDSYPEVEENYDSPYKIRALFFLPYIGNALITTNIEPSFEEVIKRLKVQPWHRILAQASSTMEMNWNQESKRIFYIHGYISAPGSLVMTGSEYNEMYPKLIPEDGRVYGARELLKKTVQDKSVLFLGASLNQDKTVEIINLEANNKAEIRRKANLHFIPVVGANVVGKIEAPPKIIHSEPFLYSEGEYQEISLLLLQLIRDSDDSWNNCKWTEPSFKCEPKDISPELKVELNRFLSPDDPDIYNAKDILNNVTPPDLIHYLYEHHSISQHDSGLGWSICCVTKNEFTLDGCERGEAFSPLHNYPLGDTVYVLYSEHENIYGESSLYKESAHKIMKEIEDWRKISFPFYAGKNGENIFGDFSPRIRVIIFPLNISYQKRELENANRNTADQSNDLGDFILKMLSQNAYNLTPDQKQRLYSLGREKILKLLGALYCALNLANDAERIRIDEVIKDHLQSNAKTLQRTLSTGGDNFEQNLQ